MGEMVFSERLRGFGLRNALALTAILAAAVTVFSHSAGANAPEFAPTITIQTSTTRAAAHPDARITIDNSNSTEQIKDLTIDLPDGLMGSLNAAEQCSVAQAQATNCPVNSQIGTVVNHATVDNSDVVLRGKVYLTEALPLTAGKIDLTTGATNTQDPASMQIVVPGKIGGVDMGNVVVNSRVQMNYGEIDPGWTNAPSGTAGPILGVRTIVNDVPKSITDSHNRTVNFELKKLIVDLKSDQVSPYSKMLTNSSRCRTTQIKLDATSYGATNFADAGNYTTTQCDDVPMSDATSTFSTSDSDAGDTFSFSTSVELPDDHPSTGGLKIQMPPAIATEIPNFGSPQDQCPVTNSGSNAAGDANIFNAAGCPSQAKVGKVFIETPLLPDPIEGDVYFSEASPIPNVGIYVDPTTGPNNPKGVTFGALGLSGTPKLNSDCPTSGISAPLGGCKTGLAISFSLLPDMPVKKITMISSGTPRPTGHDSLGNPVAPGHPTEVVLGDFLRNASPTDVNCQPVNDFTGTFNSWVGYDEDTQEFSRAGSGVVPYSISGCDPRAVTMTAAPFGGFASANPPTLTYADATGATAKCGIDTQVIGGTFTPKMVDCNPTGGIGGGASYTPGTSVDPGIHYFYTRVSSQYNVRGFSIPVEAPTDTTAPTVTLSNEPGATTADTTPSVNFTTGEDVFFQCSLDGGPYLQCDTGTAPNQSSSYTVPSALIPTDDTHTIKVRAQDAAGNVSSVETTSFKVEVPLDPTLDIDISTDVARAHPTMDLTVTSGSHEDIKDLALSMPDGFMGSLTGVQTLCPIATAQAGSCTAASQIGTVDAEAVIEDSESTVRISGKVFMTDPIALGDPAGLYVDVPAVIQDIDDGHVLVPIRMTVRGEAEGIDSIATDLPTGLNPADWGNTYDQPSNFDLRSMTLKLRNNPSASQPLLTNPSSCAAGSFAATFTGEDATVVNKSVAFTSTGCSALPFAPSLTITQKDSYNGSSSPGPSSPARRTNVDFTAGLTADPNGAGIKQVSLTLPKTLTIDVGHLPYPCMPEQAAAKNCPASAAIGSAVANSPLLPEPLVGTVYVLKSTTSLPRLLVAMRGRINVDFIGESSFVNINQIVTNFDSLPDVPLTSFSMTVNKFLMTRDEACETDPSAWNIIGTMGGHNGASSPVNNSLSFDCPAASGPVITKQSFKNKGAKSTLKMTVGAQTGKKIKKVTIKLPKGVKFNSKAFTKKKIKRSVTVKAGGKKLSTKCFRRKGTNKFEINFCRKQATSVSVSFGKGSIKSSTRKKSLKFAVTVVDSDNKRRSAILIP
jgi:hypothetical protein